jgi:hypothetical protein
MSNEVYSIKMKDITDKIAELEHSGDNLVAKGLYIAANIAGIDIADSEFCNAISNKIIKLCAEKHRKIRIRIKG